MTDEEQPNKDLETGKNVRIHWAQTKWAGMLDAWLKNGDTPTSFIKEHRLSGKTYGGVQPTQSWIYRYAGLKKITSEGTIPKTVYTHWDNAGWGNRLQVWLSNGGTVGKFIEDNGLNDTTQGNTKPSDAWIYWKAKKLLKLKLKTIAKEVKSSKKTRHKVAQVSTWRKLIYDAFNNGLTATDFIKQYHLKHHGTGIAPTSGWAKSMFTNYRRGKNVYHSGRGISTQVLKIGIKGNQQGQAQEYKPQPEKLSYKNSLSPPLTTLGIVHIDAELYQAAKAQGINVTNFCETALAKQLGLTRKWVKA